jgi:RNA polymerase sigma-B factor
MTVTGVHRAREQRWRRLILRYQSGDRAAGNQLVHEAMPYARALARRYGRTNDREDVLQAGLLGLTKAIGSYRPGQGASVSGYLLPCVAGEMRRHLRDHGWAVHMPRPLQEAALRVSRGVDQLTAGLGRAPTVPELAEALGMEPDAVLEGLRAGQAYSAGSLDSPGGGGSGSTGEGSDLPLSERLGGPDHALDWAEGRTLLYQSRSLLDHRERLIISLRFDADLTQLEIANHIGCSQMQVSRVLRGALAKLRAEDQAAA